MERVTINMLIPVIAAALTLIGGLIGGFMTWCLNERSKRKYEEYKRKEKIYSDLFRDLRGFYVGSSSKELRDEFLNQLNLCWIYCPDEVILKGYKFLDMIHTGGNYPDDEREKAINELILVMRKDLINTTKVWRRMLRKTKLKSENFRHLEATKVSSNDDK